jgi:hypothetical protein
MRTILFATAAILGMTAGTAMADRAPVNQQQLAAVALTRAQFDPRDGTVARNGLPEVGTNHQGTQLAAGGGAHPDATTNEHGTQFAAGGGAHPDATTNEHGTQYAAGGGAHPDATTNEHGTQYAAGGGRYPGAEASHG